MVLWDFGQMDGFSGRGRDMLRKLYFLQNYIDSSVREAFIININSS